MAAQKSPGNYGGRKSFLAAWLLSYFFGSLGVDRFYLDYPGLGFAKLCTFGGLGVWTFIDFARIGLGIQKDKQGRPLEGYDQDRQAFRIVTIVLVSVSGLMYLAGVIFMVAILAVTVFGA